MRQMLLTVALLLAVVTASALAQTGNASLGGSVEDPTKALIPGVTIVTKNIDTNVTVTQVTNESGVYSFPVLQPGTYEVSAELPGFKKAVQKAELPYAGQVRVNFTLEVGRASQTVEVTVDAESLLTQSSASVSDVLTQAKIESMLVVGNNVLDLLTALPGMAISPTGNTSFDTVNGLNLDTINVTRDGLSINDGRYAAGSTLGGTAIAGKGRDLLSDTTLLPDLVGEVRLVTSPVDAELGRGNAQIQIRTRSGTNRYNGSAAWYVRNSALDANTWVNNHTPFTETATGVVHNSTQKPWRNNNQYTVAYGGANSGTLYPSSFTSVADPQCTDASMVTQGDKMGTNRSSLNGGPCTIVALARANSDGTPGEVMLKYPRPGKSATWALATSKVLAYGLWT